MGTLIALPAGSYNWYDTDVSGVPVTGPNAVTVAALTAGTISPASPTVGQTLSVSGSNAPPGAAFLWQYSSDGGTTWGSAGGTNTGATYNTTGQPVGQYRRRITLVNSAQVASAAVSLSSAAGVTYTFGATAYTGSISNGGTVVTISSSGTARKVIVEMLFATDPPASLTFNGVTNTTPLVNIGGVFGYAAVYVFDVPSGISGNVTLNWGGFACTQVRTRFGFVPSTATVQAAVTQTSQTNNITLDVSQGVNSGNVVLAGLSVQNDTGSSTRVVNWTGATTDRAYAVDQDVWSAFVRKDITSTGTETITSTNTGEAGSARKSLYSIELLA